MLFEKKREKEKEIILPIKTLDEQQVPIEKCPNLMMFYEPEDKFIFEKNTELLNDLQIHIQQFLSNENNYFFIHRSFPEKILKDLIYLKEYQQNISQKEENYNLMVKNYAILTQQIANQDSMIKQIESSYIDKINDLRIEISNLNELLIKKNDEKNNIQDNFLKENSEINQKLQNEVENSKKLLDLVKVTVRENTILKDEISQLRRNLEWFTVRKKEKALLGNKIIIEDVLKTPIFFEISKFLEISDILQFQQVNKSLFFMISLDSRFISTISQNITHKYRKEVCDLQNKLTFCSKKYEEIPEDYLKSSILKFLCFDFKIGDLMPQILKKSQFLIEKDILNLKEEISTPNSFVEFFESPSIKQNLNDIFHNETTEEKAKETALDELANKNSLSHEEIEIKKPEENEKSQNFFKKWFKKSNKTDNQEAKTIRLAENIKEKRKIIDKLNIENIGKSLKNLTSSNNIVINQEFLKNFEKENNNFKNKIDVQMKNLNKTLFSKLIEYANEENYERLNEFFKEFLINFCEMILFSSILLQETKELETIKDFLLGCNERAHIDLFNLKDNLEDLKMENQAVKKLKEFLASKSKELEKKLHENDSILYKNNETIINLNNQINALDFKIKELNDEKNDQKTKIKTLIAEVKHLRTKNVEMEANLKNLISDCLEIKIQFEKIPMDV